MGDSHEVVQLSVVLFVILAMYNNVIGDSDDSFTALEDLVYHLLKDVLRASESKWQAYEPVSSPRCVECGEE